MHDVPPMPIPEPLANLDEHVLHHRDRQRCHLLDDVVEGPALDELHDEEDGFIRPLNRVDRDDVWVRQLCGGPGLEFETLDHSVTFEQVRGHDLDCDFSVESEVVGEEYRRHASSAQFAQNFVLTERHGAQRFPHRTGDTRHLCRHRGLRHRLTRWHAMGRILYADEFKKLG